MTPASPQVPVESCSHPTLTRYSGTSFETGRSVTLWACDSCSLRFYPACTTCVDVGHRSGQHPQPVSAPN